MFFAREIGLVSVRAGWARRTFRTLRALLTLNALRALEALNALRPFNTRGTGIAFGTALPGGTGRTDTCGTHGARRTRWTCGTGRTRRTMQTCGAAFREQLAGDFRRVDGTARFDRLQSTIVINDARLHVIDITAGGGRLAATDQKQ